ncbi:MAG TPA: flagellar basal body P-ring formation chaperone FlgA [Rhizomicrobium sp.]|jgi:flagella basal body P-ring formation protein FlgA
MIRTVILIASLVIATSAVADVGGMRIVVPAHDIARGETIADSDLSYLTIANGPNVSGIVTSMDQLSGMQARRVLRASMSLRGDDVRRPILVTKGSTVTMTFDAPGVTLTALGKAMTEGGMGETVTILNPVSYRQITGVVTGAGQARAGDVTAIALQQLAASH